MKPIRRSFRPRGFVSYVMVLSVGAILSLSMLYAYRSASRAMVVSGDVQERADYLHKEDAALRAVVAILPNRAIQAMQSGSNASDASRAPLLWDSIFSYALTQANARTSISDKIATSAGLSGTYKANTADSALTNISLMFQAISPNTGYVSSGCNQNLGADFPPALNADVSTAGKDQLYPIISSTKYYGSYADGQVGLSVTDYPRFNQITYPEIDFGYCTPGAAFVAKRNWWAFSVNTYRHNAAAKGGVQLDRSREFVLSLYEIPSQLAISANAFTALGQHESGAAWQNITVEGEVYAGKAQVEGNASLTRLASRRGMSFTSGTKVGGKSFSGDPFSSPGDRAEYQITTGNFFPVSLSSETGRASFVPINRGAEFFDRHALTTESNTLSPTTWNNYSVGALQCAMQLDVTNVVSSTNQTPTALRFTYKKGGVDVSVPLTAAEWGKSDVPFDVIALASGKPCVVIKPELFAAYLASPDLGGDNLSVNHSIVVNADYTLNTTIQVPSIPCDPAKENSDIGLVLEDCADLTAFTKGFSIVTNFRLYIADDFNIVETTPPTGVSSPYYPPTSLFAPERRFGKDQDPEEVEQSGQIGSLAADDSNSPIRPFDLKTGKGTSLAADQITANLKQITHPAALPPVTMLNWLVVLEER